jgi:hypothetical protein
MQRARVIVRRDRADILASCLAQWMRFSLAMANRGQLHTVTDRDIHIADKIFRNIASLQRKIST